MYVCVCMYINMCVCTYVYVCMYVCMYVFMYVCIMYVCMYAYMYVCILCDYTLRPTQLPILSAVVNLSGGRVGLSSPCSTDVQNENGPTFTPSNTPSLRGKRQLHHFYLLCRWLCLMCECNCVIFFNLQVGRRAVFCLAALIIISTDDSLAGSNIEVCITWVLYSQNIQWWPLSAH